MAGSEQVLSELVPMGLFGPNPFRWSYTPRWPMAALTLGDWSYIRREGKVAEELYRVREDARRAARPCQRPCYAADVGTDAMQPWAGSRPDR